jgi:protein-disulfide isomerase
MIALGKKAGISSSAFANCVNNNKFDGWVSKVEDSAASKNVNATPTVFVNGKEIDRQTQYMNADAFKAAITAAGAK